MLIHQIWLNPKDQPPPPHCQRWMRAWEGCGEYKLWTPENLPAPRYPELLKWCEQRWAHAKRFYYKAASDLWRYQLLDELGGFYVDIDCELLGDFSRLTSSPTPTVFCPHDPGMGVWHRSNSKNIVCNGLLYFPQSGHPVWNKMFEMVHDNVRDNVRKYPGRTTGPELLRKVWQDTGCRRVMYPVVSFEKNVHPDTTAVFHMRWRMTKRYE